MKALSFSLRIVCMAILAAHASGDEEANKDLVIEVNPNDWLKECFFVTEATCCRDTAINPYALPLYYNMSSFVVEAAPSGLCLPEFLCSWENCYPSKYEKNLFTSAVTFVDEFAAFQVDETTTYDDVEAAFPGISLPSKISFPTKPADVVGAIEHAKKEGLQVSILSTGHSYTGASSGKGTLQLNMRDYPKYSASSLTECKDKQVVENEDHPDHMACKLALARNKNALIRVGGGEKFNETANAVWALKDEKTGFAKYNMLHGVGSVGSAGGWLQGGGLGWGQERLWGFGVDQVLELELVLADGRHVKLHPSEWEDVEGYIYPKTTKVEGFCNTNTMTENESEWSWEPCEEPAPPFEDLWFAVRGGGGGTYAVLTSVKIQLHDSTPFYIVMPNQDPNYGTELIMELMEAYNTTLNEEEISYIGFMGAVCDMKYAIDFLFNPEKVNATREQSNSCGAPAIYFTGPSLYCLGEDAAIASRNAWLSTLEQCVPRVLPQYSDFFSNYDFSRSVSEILGPADSILDFHTYDAGAQEDIPGQLGDDGPSIFPQKAPYQGWSSAQVPEAWLASATDEELSEVFLLNPSTAEHITGGNVGIAHDQMTAVPEIQRQTGFSSSGFAYLPVELQEKLLSTFLDTWETDSSSFPGMSEYNHISVGSFGSLKSDPSKVCPVPLSTEEKEEQCFTMQEAVWGVEGAKKLGKIKKAVDPDHLFYCYGCIQPYVDDDVATPTTTEDETSSGDPDTVPESEPDEDMDSPVELDAESTSSRGVVSFFRAGILSAILVAVWGCI